MKIIIEEYRDHSDRELLHQLLLEFHYLNLKIQKIMNTQDQINADVAAIKAALGKISEDNAALAAGIAALQGQVAGGTPVDLTQLDALAAQAATVQASVDATAAALTPTQA